MNKADWIIVVLAIVGAISGVASVTVAAYRYGSFVGSVECKEKYRGR